MKLWTFQPNSVVETIMNGGVFYCDPKKSTYGNKNDPYSFYSFYCWYVQEMQKRLPKPDQRICLPIWAWRKQGNKVKKPDLRKMENISYNNKYSLLELDVPEKEVLLSDFDKWNIVLLDLNLDEYNDETEDFEDSEKPFTKSEKETSWEDIFNLGKPSNFIQATFWELKKEYIKNIYKINRK